MFVGGRLRHHAWTNLSSNMMANWVLASYHSRAGIFHSPAVWRKTKNSSVVVARAAIASIARGLQGHDTQFPNTTWSGTMLPLPP